MLTAAGAPGVEIREPTYGLSVECWRQTARQLVGVIFSFRRFAEGAVFDKRMYMMKGGGSCHHVVTDAKRSKCQRNKVTYECKGKMDISSYI